MSPITTIPLKVRFSQSSNCFIRLHSSVLHCFGNDFSQQNTCLEIRIEDKVVFGSCSSIPLNTNGEDAFNVNATYADTLGLKEYDVVIVSNFRHIKSLKTVHVSPESPDDWDVLAVNVDTVQTSLLDQIRVVYVNQTVPIWISKSFPIRITIDSLSIPDSCGKLEEYTEVIVSPWSKKPDKREPIVEQQEMKEISWGGYFKNILSSVWSKETAKARDPRISDEFAVCRLLPTDILQTTSEYEYSAFVTTNTFSRLSGSTCDPYKQLYRLTMIPFTPIDTGRADNAVSDEEPVPNTTEVPKNTMIFVHVYKIDNVKQIEEYYPSIYISSAVQKLLGGKLNSKVAVQLVEGEENEKLPALTLNVSVIRRKVIQTPPLPERLKQHNQKIVDELRTYFQQRLRTHKKLVLNSYSEFDIGSGTVNEMRVKVTFATENNRSFVEFGESDLDLWQFSVIVEKVRLTGPLPIRFVKPEKKYANLKLFDELLKKAKAPVAMNLLILKEPSLMEPIGHATSCIVTGEIGTGKSTVIDMLDNYLRTVQFVYTKKMECKRLKGKLISKLTRIFENAVKECVYHQPATLFLDDLDTLFMVTKHSGGPQAEDSLTSYTNRLSSLLHDIFHSCSTQLVTVFATCQSISYFDVSIFGNRSAVSSFYEIKIPNLDESDRLEAFSGLLRMRTDCMGSESFISEYVGHLVKNTEGYYIQDIVDLINQIFFHSVRKQMKIGSAHEDDQPVSTIRLLKKLFDCYPSPVRYVDTEDEGQYDINWEDIIDVIENHRPLSLKGVDFDKRTDERWNNVGGLDSAKQLLQEILIWPSRHKRIFLQCPMNVQCGVLLYGAPGTGKTLLARAVAGESRLNFISVKGPELLSKYIGESEQGVRDTFKKAKNAKPCILFFDEFDSLAPRRGNDITGVTDRVVNQLLTEMDGVESLSGVWVLAATSRPDLIDPALLRAGRLGTLIECPFPDKKERVAILKILSNGLNVAEDVDFSQIANETEGYTGADLQSIFTTARLKVNNVGQMTAAAVDSDDFATSTECQNKIDMITLLEATNETKPSLKPKERQYYEQICSQFQNRSKGDQSLNRQRVTYA